MARWLRSRPRSEHERRWREWAEGWAEQLALDREEADREAELLYESLDYDKDAIRAHYAKLVHPEGGADVAKHPNGPWWNATKRRWYCTHDGKNVSLRVEGEANRVEALAAWHRLKAGVGEVAAGRTELVAKPQVEPVGSPTLGRLAEDYFAEKGAALKASTLAQYRIGLASFLEIRRRRDDRGRSRLPPRGALARLDDHEEQQPLLHAWERQRDV